MSACLPSSVISELLHIGFKVDSSRKASSTRYGPAAHGSYDSAAVIHGPLDSHMSSCGYAMTTCLQYNLHALPTMLSDEASGFMRPQTVKALPSGHVVAIYDDFLCTAAEALEQDIFADDPLTDEDGNLTITGSKVLYQAKRLMRTTEQGLWLHPEMDLSTTVIKSMHGSRLEMALLSSPFTQKLLDSSSKVSILAPLARPVGMAAPPELNYSSTMVTGFSLQTMTYLIAGVFASMFEGKLDSIAGEDSVRYLEPPPLRHLFANMLSARPSLRPDASLVEGHYLNYHADPAKLGEFLNVAGSSFGEYVRNREHHPLAAAVDNIGAGTFMGAARIDNMPDKVKTLPPWARAMYLHSPANLSSKESQPGSGTPVTWQPSRLVVGFRNTYQHWKQKASWYVLRNYLALKHEMTHPKAFKEFASRLVQKAFKEASWQLWKAGYDECLDFMLEGDMAQF